MGWTVTPWKCSAPTFSVTAVLDGLERGLHRRRIAQIQLHPADVRLVRDGERVQLQHDGIANLLRSLQRLLFGDRYPGIHGWNVVSLEQLLRLILRQDGAARLTDLLDDVLGLPALHGRILMLRQCWSFI